MGTAALGSTGSPRDDLFHLPHFHSPSRDIRQSPPASQPCLVDAPGKTHSCAEGMTRHPAPTWIESDRPHCSTKRSALLCTTSMATSFKWKSTAPASRRTRTTSIQSAFLRTWDLRAESHIEMLLTDPNGRSEFIGVWGRKAITDFKRTLGERGAKFAVLPANASGRVVKRHFAVSNQTRAVSAGVKNPDC